MLGNYKPLSYMYIFLKEDLERITRKLATGGVKVADLGNAGCCGVCPLDRKNLDEVLAAGKSVAKEKLEEAQTGLRQAMEEFFQTLDGFCYIEARRVPQFCVTKKSYI